MSDAHFAKVLIDRLWDRNGDPLGFANGVAAFEFAGKVRGGHDRKTNILGCP